MKTVTSHLAQLFKDLDLDAFREKYIKEHPQGSNLSPDNIRQGFDEYKRYCRRFKKHAKT